MPATMQSRQLLSQAAASSRGAPTTAHGAAPPHMAPLSFLSGCCLVLAGCVLAASGITARTAALLLAGCLATSAVPARAAALLLAGCVLAASGVPARAAALLLAASSVPALLLAGYLLAASAVPARATGVLIASRGSAMRARRSLAASAVPARAAGHLLASRGSATRAHRAASLVCLLLLAACAVPARAAGGDVDPYVDEPAMRAIATALGADQALGWTNDTSPCVDGWIGVVCNRRGRVSAIHARNASLNGTLAQDIGNLQSLDELDLRDNSITGDVPNVVFLDMKRLRLDGNKFTTIPDEFLGAARSLQIFSISNSSQLRSWELPNGPLRFDTTLQVLIADHAQLSGTLSSFLGNRDSFKSLNLLSLANNQLTGEVPATFASQTLTYLDFSYNFLSGPVDFVANLPELEVLRLNGNGFTGPLPDFSGHWSLTLVDFANNRLTGVVPASLVRLRSLSSVSIDGNLFQGAVPEFAGSAQTDIAKAALHGSFCRPETGPCDRRVDSFIAIAGAFRFPEAFAASWKGNRPCDGWIGVYCDKRGMITGVNFARLGLNGTLDPAFGDLKSLVMINLAGNNLTGNVPRSITALPSLRILDVSDNSLSGTMPTFQRGVTIWAGGNKNLTVAGASVQGISDPMRRFAATASAAIVVLVLA